MSVSILRIGCFKALAFLEKSNCYSVLASTKLLSHNSLNFQSQNQRLHIGLTNNKNIKEYSKQAGQQLERRKVYARSESESDSDSDDEKIKKNHKGESEFWRRKMRTVHSLLDVNKDGVISFDDFKLLTDKFVNLGHLTDEQTAEFRECIKIMWESNWGEITPYNLVTVQQYLDDMHHVMNDKQLKKKVHKFLPYLFKAVDKDNSGEISVEEFKLFFECLGIDEKQAVISFSLIDTNSDGLLSIKEFVKHGRNYYISENEDCVSKVFWGPLIK